MSDLEIQLRKYCGKKTKGIIEEEKEKCKTFFKVEKDIFIIEKFTHDITECCKLPEAIELRKKQDIITTTYRFEKKHQQQKK